MKPRAKKCDICKRPIENRRNSLQVVCSMACALEFNKRKEAKKQREQTKKDKDELLTHSDWLKILQKVFNRFIRERDKHKGCISCGKALDKKFDAGHFFSVGSSPDLRFHEDNVHGQCVACNQHAHGNLIEYTLRLPNRIGQARFDELHRLKGKPLKLSIPEIQELIKAYKLKIKPYI